MPETAEQEQLDVEKLLRELNVAAQGLASANTRLRDDTRNFEGALSDEGEITLGISLRWEIAVEEEIEAIVKEYEDQGKRPPAEDIRLARAKRQARAKQMGLFVEYMQGLTELKASRTWISAQKQVISAKQTVLNGLRALGA